ncbi:unnamed protein product [Rhizophagus irregularis]|nr:unnamed protein product [Rhizophagus irregularis]
MKTAKVSFVSFTNSVLFHLRSWFFAVSGSLRFLIGRFSFLCDTSRKGLRFFTRRFRFFVIAHRKTGFQFLQFFTEREVLVIFSPFLRFFRSSLLISSPSFRFSVFLRFLINLNSFLRLFWLFSEML